jgi:hypothetical protein
VSYETYSEPNDGPTKNEMVRTLEIMIMRGWALRCRRDRLKLKKVPDFKGLYKFSVALVLEPVILLENASCISL